MTGHRSRVKPLQKGYRSGADAPALRRHRRAAICRRICGSAIFMPRWRRIGPQLLRTVLRTVTREVRMSWRLIIRALASGLMLAGVMTTNVIAQPRDDWRRGHRAEWE